MSASSFPCLEGSLSASHSCGQTMADYEAGDRKIVGARDEGKGEGEAWTQLDVHDPVLLWRCNGGGEAAMLAECRSLSISVDCRKCRGEGERDPGSVSICGSFAWQFAKMGNYWKMGKTGQRESASAQAREREPKPLWPQAVSPALQPSAVRTHARCSRSIVPPSLPALSSSLRQCCLPWCTCTTPSQTTTPTDAK